MENLGRFHLHHTRKYWVLQMRCTVWLQLVLLQLHHRADNTEVAGRLVPVQHVEDKSLQVRVQMCCSLKCQFVDDFVVFQQIACLNETCMVHFFVIFVFDWMSLNLKVDLKTFTGWNLLGIKTL